MCIPFNIDLVIVCESGRLGNQLFQYAAIRKVAPKAKVLNVGMQSLVNWLQEIEVVEDFFVRKLLLAMVKSIGRRLLFGMAGKGRLLSLITEAYVANQCVISCEKGFISGIAVLSGYFQDEHTLDTVSRESLSIDSTILDEAKTWIDSQVLMPSMHQYFVHVRRGDYVSWPSRENPAVLSFSWYKAQIERIRVLDNSAQFLVFSDDVPYVEEFFGGFSDIFISRGSEERDLAAMSLCHGGGVLSASSFAWWGSYYSMTNNPEALFIAPRFWCNWRECQWYPLSIETSWLHYVEGF